jgi:NAD(P)-dependent dehydrogenase (short-subunit alcohol dehydrogenase family)
VLCNNAGVLIFGTMQDLKVDDWRWVLGVNVFGVLNGVYTFLPRMLERGEPCHIVNTASIASLSGRGVYGVSKSAILNITETLHADLEGTNVGVTALLPGMLNTKIVAAQRNRPAAYGEKADEPFGSEPVSFGVDPLYCGIRVREAILAGELYAFAGIPEGTDEPLRTGPVTRAAALVAAIDAGVVGKEEDPTVLARAAAAMRRSGGGRPPGSSPG